MLFRSVLLPSILLAAALLGLQAPPSDLAAQRTVAEHTREMESQDGYFPLHCGTPTGAASWSRSRASMRTSST